MPNPLFRIEDLRCSYNGKDVVVHIKDLTIERGKFIGLLSVSGGGKSTTLETLGLMNRTFLPDSNITFFPEETGAGYSYTDLWKPSQEKAISALRARYFSFIFQRTNLMPNFTAYENICITQMIQGKSQAEAIVHAKEVMEELGLEKVDESKKAYELSGGEQQRVAFVRAITPEFSVIFGDEPTGNLDDENSRLLMDRLQKTIREKNRTALIVSHDLDLMKEYADQLLVLQKPHKTGELLPENVFHCQISPEGARVWQDHTGQAVPELNRAIRRIMKWEDAA
ncbi:MAG: ATP-binding cassette domain-containing protein [Bacteroidota bacterium]